MFEQSSGAIGRAMCLVALLVLLPVPALPQSPVFAGSWPVQGKPCGLAMDSNGNVLLTTEVINGPPVLRYSPVGTLMSYMGVLQVANVYGVAATPNGDIFYAGYQFGRMWHMSSTGAYIGDGWGRSDCCLLFIALDTHGTCPEPSPCTNVYATDWNHNRVYHYRNLYPGDYYVGEWPVANASGIVFLGGVLYVVSFNGVVGKYSPTGTPLGSFSTGATNAKQLAAGPDGRLYLADYGTSRLLILSTDGLLLGTLDASVSGYSHGPVKYFGVAVANDGTVFAGDYDHSRVLRFVPQSTPARMSTWGGLKTHYR